MCQAAIHLISKALGEVDSAPSVLAVKKKLAEFAHTMDVSRAKITVANQY